MTSLSEAFELAGEAARRQMEQDAIPGMAMAITDGDGLVFEQYFGHASLEAERPVHADHLFEIGSIGKSFTCILLLQLAEEQRLSLHDPVTKYLPWFDVQSEFEPITLHHLMTHSAGITNGTDFPADARYEVWALRESRAVNPPGERFHYSNVAYKALGLVLEVVTGERYPDLVQHRILDPLGMADTVPEITHDTRERLATGYRRFYDDRPAQQHHGHVPATWLETDTADGCIASTARDLATYMRMLMNGGVGASNRILSEKSFAAMTTPYIERGDDTGYGYGLQISDDGGTRHLSHGGGMVGYYANMIWNPAINHGVVTLINGPGRQGPVAKAALDAIEAFASGLPLPDIGPVEDPFAVPDATEYAKTYQSDGAAIQFIAVGQGLCLVFEDEVIPLERFADDSFLANHPDLELFPLAFERDADGEVVSVHYGKSTWHAPGRIADHQQAHPEWTALRGHYRSHNPWQSNFRIIVRDVSLILAWPSGHEEQLLPAGDGSFQLSDVNTPEFIRFDAFVNGEAWRANLSGCEYYRFFTP